MKHSREPDAKGIGACLNDSGSVMHKLLTRANRLAEIQAAIREWAGEPLGSSLTVANEREGTLVVYAASAGALTQIRYRQQELIQFLRQRLDLASTKVEAKIVPTGGNG
ncbi:MAG: DciA family protein [Nevskia sp.]|nr:DciA family protein [Nevskia sp.]